MSNLQVGSIHIRERRRSEKARGEEETRRRSAYVERAEEKLRRRRTHVLTVSSSVIPGTDSEAKGVGRHEVGPFVLRDEKGRERERPISEGDEKTRTTSTTHDLLNTVSES